MREGGGLWVSMLIYVYIIYVMYRLYGSIDLGLLQGWREENLLEWSYISRKILFIDNLNIMNKVTSSSEFIFIQIY